MRSFNGHRELLADFDCTTKTKILLKCILYWELYMSLNQLMACGSVGGCAQNIFLGKNNLKIYCWNFIFFINFLYLHNYTRQASRKHTMSTEACFQRRKNFSGFAQWRWASSPLLLNGIAGATQKAWMAHFENPHI